MLPRNHFFFAHSYFARSPPYLPIFGPRSGSGLIQAWVWSWPKTLVSLLFLGKPKKNPSRAPWSLLWNPAIQCSRSQSGWIWKTWIVQTLWYPANQKSTAPVDPYPHSSSPWADRNFADFWYWSVSAPSDPPYPPRFGEIRQSTDWSKKKMVSYLLVCSIILYDILLYFIQFHCDISYSNVLHYMLYYYDMPYSNTVHSDPAYDFRIHILAV